MEAVWEKNRRYKYVIKYINKHSRPSCGNRPCGESKPFAKGLRPIIEWKEAHFSGGQPGWIVGVDEIISGNQPDIRAQSNVQNAISFMEVQDGMLDTVGRIVDRMSELKGLSSQDPMKSEQDRKLQ